MFKAVVALQSQVKSDIFICVLSDSVFVCGIIKLMNLVPLVAMPLEILVEHAM